MAMTISSKQSPNLVPTETTSHPTLEIGWAGGARRGNHTTQLMMILKIMRTWINREGVEKLKGKESPLEEIIERTEGILNRGQILYIHQMRGGSLEEH